MPSSTAQEYLDLFGDDPPARLALLACSAALRLDDETAHAAVELVAHSNGSTAGLVRRVKGLGCVWKEWDGTWHVTDDVRRHLLDRLHEDVPAATLDGLRARLAANADERAERLPPDGQITNHDKLLSKFEAAYQRIHIPEKAEEGAAQLGELWRQSQQSGPEAAQATAQAVDYLADEFNRRLPRLPDEVIFLQGMAARSRGDKGAQEKYFRIVWERGRHGYIYSVAAHLFGLLIQRQNRKTAERALRDGIRWDVDDFGRAIKYHSLGNLLARDRGRWQEAERAFRQSIEIDKDDRSRAKTLHSLGNLLAKDRGRWAEAENAYKRSIETVKDDRNRARMLHSLGNLLARDRSRWQEAERAFRQSIEIDKDDRSRAETLHSLGKLLFDIPERREEADATLKQSFISLESTPDGQAQVLATWAYALVKLNDAESDTRAKQYARQAIKLDPNNPRTTGVGYRVLTSVYERRRAYQKAIDAAEEWLKTNEQLRELATVRRIKSKIAELRRKLKQPVDVKETRKSKKKKWREN